MKIILYILTILCKYTHQLSNVWCLPYHEYVLLAWVYKIVLGFQLKTSGARSIWQDLVGESKTKILKKCKSFSSIPQMHVQGNCFMSL